MPPLTLAMPLLDAIHISPVGPKRASTETHGMKQHVAVGAEQASVQNAVLPMWEHARTKV